MEKKGFWLAGVYLTVLTSSLGIMYYLGIPSAGRFGLAVDIGVTGTAIFESLGGLLMLASFIRDRHKREGREESDRQWEAWNARRLEAESRNEPFDEPTPSEKKRQQARS